MLTLVAALGGDGLGPTAAHAADRGDAAARRRARDPSRHRSCADPRGLTRRRPRLRAPPRRRSDARPDVRPRPARRPSAPASRSTAVATATASASASTARADGRWPAQTAADDPRPLLPGHDLRDGPARQPIRVLRAVGFAAPPRRRRSSSTGGGGRGIDGIATTFPDEARLECSRDATTASRDAAHAWRVRVISPTGAVLRDAAGPAALRRARRDAADPAPGLVQAVRVRPVPRHPPGPPTARARDRGQRAAARALPARRRARRDAVDLADRGAQGAVDRGALLRGRRLRPSVSYYDVVDDTSSQVYVGVLGEKATTNAAIDATAGVVLKNGSAIANTLFHSTGGGATEHNENVYVSATGARSRGRSATCADRPIGAPTGPHTTTARRTRHGRRRRTPGPSSRHGSPRTPDERRHADRARPARRGRLRAADPASRSSEPLGSKTVSGDVFRSVFNAGRPSGNPLFRSTLFDTKPVP